MGVTAELGLKRKLMGLSNISLLQPDSERLREDAGAKSVSFFVLRRPVKIDAAVIGELKEVSERRGGSNVRVCLHAGPDAVHHDMIILENQGKYYRPHKHDDKGEAFHIIEGRMGIFAFDESGAVIDAVVLEPQEIYRVEAGMYHAVLPLTDRVIYHENKPGPFTGEGDSIFPEWAPDGTNNEEVAAYVAALRSRINV